MTVNIAPSPVDEALVDLLATDTDPSDGWVALVPGGTWHLVAPEEKPSPWCVFGVLGPSEDAYTLAGWAFSRILYGFDIIQEGGSAERAATATKRLFTLLNDTAALNPTGLVVMNCRRTGYAERLERTEGGVLFQHLQSIYSIMVRPQ